MAKTKHLQLSIDVPIALRLRMVTLSSVIILIPYIPEPADKDDNPSEVRRRCPNRVH